MLSVWHEVNSASAFLLDAQSCRRTESPNISFSVFVLNEIGVNEELNQNIILTNVCTLFFTSYS